MSNIPEKRKDAIKKLGIMMNYPGRFSILVLGDTGTGKTHWIKEKIKNAEEFKNNYTFKNASLCKDTEDFWQDIFNEADEKYLIIEETEKLSKHSQELIFKALSTENGLYGFDKKDKTIRIIFTSTFPIKKLRDDRRYLSAKFFDRISQFVVEFPNFGQTQRNIFDDIKATWKKMFDNDDDYKDKCPYSKELKNWLEVEANRMHGNFRDLDKIVINWNLWQREEKKDDEILEIIKNDFKDKLHNPNQKIYEDNTYVFDEDGDYYENLDNFKSKFKKWALALNNNDKRKTARMLNVSHRTMERW